MIPSRRIAACGFVVLLTSGCYAYTPVDLHQIRVDDDVRARVTTEHARELDPILMRDARVVEGRVLEVGRVGQEFLIQVPVHSEFRGTAAHTLSQRVHVPYSEIAAVELRTFDRTRTGLLAGGGLAVAVGVVIRAFTRQSGGDTRPDPGTPDELRMPVRLPLLGIVR
jgi:hypothetical protein